MSLLLSPIFSEAPAKAEGLPANARVQKIASAESWDGVISQMDKLLPDVTVREFRALTKAIPFPTIRTIRDELLIIDELGQRIRMRFVAKGDLTINGKPVELHPLSPIHSELEYIQTIFVPRPTSSLFDKLFTSAYASSLLNIGLSSLVYAGANTWKAEACQGEHLTEELMQVCSTMGVGMLHRVAGGKEDLFKPISLKCPAENASELEVIRKSTTGLSMRVKGTYKGDKLVFIRIDAAQVGERFKPVLEGVPSGKAVDKDGENLLATAVQTQRLKDLVCDSTDPSMRSRYNAILEGNRLARLKPQRSDISDENSALNAN